VAEGSSPSAPEDESGEQIDDRRQVESAAAANDELHPIAESERRVTA
jgi:hypothetical protein